jgi:hypothetical protein
VEGNLETPSFVVEEGAVLNGNLSMSKGGTSLKAIKGGDDQAKSGGSSQNAGSQKGGNGGS